LNHYAFLNKTTGILHEFEPTPDSQSTFNTSEALVTELYQH